VFILRKNLISRHSKCVSLRFANLPSAAQTRYHMQSTAQPAAITSKAHQPAQAQPPSSGI
jgi:hypothetical protein